MKDQGFYLRSLMGGLQAVSAFTVSYDKAEDRVSINLLREKTNPFGERDGELYVWKAFTLPLEAANFLADDIRKIEEPEDDQESK